MKFTEQEYERCRMSNLIHELETKLQVWDDSLGYIMRGVEGEIKRLRELANDKCQTVESMSLTTESIAYNLESLLK